MSDFVAGELLKPKWLKRLTWDSLDTLLAGQEVRRQKDLEGFRLVAVQAYNLVAEPGLSPKDYLHLPAVDGELKVLGGPKRDAWKERMKQRYGDKLEA